MGVDEIRGALGHVCTCIRTDCWHPSGRCEEPPQIRGGICVTCRYHPTPQRCPTCGQVLPEKGNDDYRR